MPIIVKLDVELAKQKVSLTALSKKVGISLKNLSLLKKGHVRAIRFSTLEAICRELHCQPGDILVYEKELGGDGSG
ncbi:MAG: helix-turn-helix transcriptional regulator [Bacteroidota bacterium]